MESGVNNIVYPILSLWLNIADFFLPLVTSPSLGHTSGTISSI